jgi:hypothetical protein
VAEAAVDGNEEEEVGRAAGKDDVAGSWSATAFLFFDLAACLRSESEPFLLLPSAEDLAGGGNVADEDVDGTWEDVQPKSRWMLTVDSGTNRPHTGHSTARRSGETRSRQGGGEPVSEDGRRWRRIENAPSVLIWNDWSAAIEPRSEAEEWLRRNRQRGRCWPVEHNDDAERSFPEARRARWNRANNAQMQYVRSR